MIPIKIPKFADVEKYDLLTVQYIKRGTRQVRNAMEIVLDKQTILGIEIPKGTKVYVPIRSCIVGTIHQDKAHIHKWKINELLRTIIIDNLKKK